VIVFPGFSLFCFGIDHHAYCTGVCVGKTCSVLHSSNKEKRNHQK
jgi:hypothetical protein